jgi:uncharacterized protein YukE
MHQLVTVVALATVTALAPGMAEARKVCRSAVEVTGDYDTRRGGKAAIKRKWERKAGRRYGGEYGDWKVAKNKTRHLCRKINLRVDRGGSSAPKAFSCKARAKPCVTKTARKTCYARVTSRKVKRFDSEIRDKGNRKKAARGAAIGNWETRVHNRYGHDFANWWHAKKKRVRCKMWGGFTIGSPHAYCQASARPCDN